jgi:phosphocarrier protein HPr
MIEFELMIQNNKGLHARASAKLVELVEAFDARCEITKQNMTVSGDSIMGLLMLSAAKGSSIKFRFWGRECESLSIAIRDLINNHFGEEQ